MFFHWNSNLLIFVLYSLQHAQTFWIYGPAVYLLSVCYLFFNCFVCLFLEFIFYCYLFLLLFIFSGMFNLVIVVTWICILQFIFKWSHDMYKYVMWLSMLLIHKYLGLYYYNFLPVVRFQRKLEWTLTIYILDIREISHVETI